jgi:hypothetical protein
MRGAFFTFGSRRSRRACLVEGNSGNASRRVLHAEIIGDSVVLSLVFLGRRGAEIHLRAVALTTTVTTPP